jgi:hypothetical protein
MHASSDAAPLSDANNVIFRVHQRAGFRGDAQRYVRRVAGHADRDVGYPCRGVRLYLAQLFETHAECAHGHGQLHVVHLCALFYFEEGDVDLGYRVLHQVHNILEEDSVRVGHACQRVLWDGPAHHACYRMAEGVLCRHAARARAPLRDRAANIVFTVSAAQLKRAGSAEA